MAAAVPGVAVVADPAERRHRLVLNRLGEQRQSRDLRPDAADRLVRDDVEREAERVLAVRRVDGVAE